MTHVAVIGGGYAGLAAAVTLAEQRVPVTVFEAGRQLGGRARRIDHRDVALDNGLHILIGAYVETLRLIKLVNPAHRDALLRLPLEWRVQGEFHLRAARLPAPLHLLIGLLRADGLSIAEKFSAARLLVALRLRPLHAGTGYERRKPAHAAPPVRETAPCPVASVVRGGAQYAARPRFGAGVYQRAARHASCHPRSQRSRVRASRPVGVVSGPRRDLYRTARRHGAALATRDRDRPARRGIRNSSRRPPHPTHACRLRHLCASGQCVSDRHHRAVRHRQYDRTPAVSAHLLGVAAISGARAASLPDAGCNARPNTLGVRPRKSYAGSAA